MPTFDPTKIEEKIDRAEAGAIAVKDSVGGIMLERMSQVMELAKMMSLGEEAVPAYCRGRPAVCFALFQRALRWGIDPYGLAEMGYLTETKSGDKRLSFMAQLFSAVVNSSGLLKDRLRFEIIGEGDERRAKVWGQFKDADKPHEFISHTLKELRGARGKNQYGSTKGSPLWDDQPDVQLAYSGMRQWCRLYASDLMMGVYTPDEVAEMQGEQAKDVTPPKSGVGERLKARRAKGEAKGPGFDHGAVVQQIEANATEAENPNKSHDTATPGGPREAQERANPSEGHEDAPNHESANLGVA